MSVAAGQAGPSCQALCSGTYLSKKWAHPKLRPPKRVYLPAHAVPSMSAMPRATFDVERRKAQLIQVRKCNNQGVHPTLTSANISETPGRMTKPVLPCCSSLRAQTTISFSNRSTAVCGFSS